MSTTKDTPSINGTSPLAEAIAYEQAIADEAKELRADSPLDGELFLKLLPLLRRPIHSAHIVDTPAVKGKPYESTGIKSVQVQFDRMDAVLTPLWWRYSDTYEAEGALCHVAVSVGLPNQSPLVMRSSWGGVNQASTMGNRYKGSFTNAAKLALARVGPGHEVYVGATDFDPDVDPDAAKAQATGSSDNLAKPMQPNAIERVVKAFTDAGIEGEDFKLYLSSVGLQRVEDMTAADAFNLRDALDAHLVKA